MGALPPQSSGPGSALLGLGVLAAWVAFGLIGHDPWKPDEAYTFGLVWHIVDAGEWLVPTLGGEPFVEKPPLFFWTAALFVKALDWLLPAHDAARLASGFYVAAALWFTYLASGRRIAAALLLAGCLGYLQHAHQLLTDNALVAGIALGIYGLASRNGLLLGTGAGVAFLSKGLLGPGMLGLSALALLAFPAWRVRPYLVSLAWAALAFVPWALIWPALLYLRSKALFDEWFWVNNLGRFSGSAGLGGVLDHWLYIKALPWFALPALPAAAWTAWRERNNPSEIRLPLVVFAVMLVVLSAASSARTLYALPMLVPLAILGAAALGSLPGWLRVSLEQIGLWGGGLAAAFLWIAWLALLLGWPLASRLAEFSPGYPPHISVVPLLFAIAATAAWLFVVLVAPRDELRMPITWTAGITAAWALAMTIWLPFLDYSKSYRSVVEDFQRHLVPGACVASRNLTEPQRAVFHYFAGVVSSREGTPAARRCPLLLVHSSSKAEPPHGGEWKIVWRGTRPGDDKEYFWLLQR
jgi:4-amino-4-deoxy-L-arabinose transferase-like glycosyltransferase